MPDEPPPHQAHRARLLALRGDADPRWVVVGGVLATILDALEHHGDVVAAIYHQGREIMDAQSRIDADFAEMSSTLTDITSQLKAAAANATQRTADALGPIADKLDAFKSALDTAAGKVAAQPPAPAAASSTSTTSTSSVADPSTGRGA